MGLINKYFDKIYCIHVVGNSDRLNNIKKLSSMLQSKIHIFPACTPKTCVLPTNLSIIPEEYACAMSHIKLWDYALTDNYKRCLILEDDAILNNDIDLDAMLIKCGDQLVDEKYNLSFLGLNYKCANLISISDNLVSVKRAYALHAYSPTKEGLCFFKKHISETFLKNNQKPIDVHTANLYSQMSTIAIKPPIFIQKAGYSLIQKHVLDYRESLK